MKKYIPYAAAALIGFHLRWIASALNGLTGYRMNGADIVVAIICIIMVWSFRGLLPQKKRRARRVHHKRAHARHNAVSKRTEP
jgi:hypothetical protein|nr:MAG TPA: hypothetical protein [Caudoviricetes sp.]